MIAAFAGVANPFHFGLPRSGETVSTWDRDIGVAEDAGTSSVTSMQLGGVGASYVDFTWTEGSSATRGVINVGQTFVSQAAITRVVLAHWEKCGVVDGTSSRCAYPLTGRCR